ncbi:MAG: signal peptidase II [Sphingomonadales bacterium]|nr:signal peptidase II [Sphingomonadales bacterium]MDE2170057.1 signal peptidase II [Sphingomonadales bacterium]
MSLFTRNRLLGLGVAALTFAADQAVKWAVVHPINLMGIHMRHLISGQWDAATPDLPIIPFFGLSWQENYGVSLGLFTAGSDMQRWGLVGVTALIALFVAIWLFREKRFADTAALGMILGGALGNIRDRASLGFVVDYADLHFGALRPFLIFNLADAAITIGVLIILARSFLSGDKRAAGHQDRAHTATES